MGMVYREHLLTCSKCLRLLLLLIYLRMSMADAESGTGEATADALPLPVLWVVMVSPAKARTNHTCHYGLVKYHYLSASLSLSRIVQAGNDSQTLVLSWE